MKLTKFFEIVGIVVVSLFVLRLFYIQIEIPVTTIDCDIRITQSNDRAEIDKKNNIYYLPEGGNFNIKVDILYKHIIHNYSWMKDYYPEVQIYQYESFDNIYNKGAPAYYVITVYKDGELFYTNDEVLDEVSLKHDFRYTFDTQYVKYSKDINNVRRFIAEEGSYRVEVKCTMIIDGKTKEKKYDKEFEIRFLKEE